MPFLRHYVDIFLKHFLFPDSNRNNLFCKHIFFLTLKSLLLPNKQKVLLQIFRYRFSLGAKQLTREKDKLKGWHLSLCNALNFVLVEMERFKPPSVNNILPVFRFQQLINAT